MTIPQEFVLMDRAAIGLGGVFLHLKAEMNFYRLFNEQIDQFSLEDRHRPQNAALRLRRPHGGLSPHGGLCGRSHLGLAGLKWCHLLADSEEELHRFARAMACTA